MPDFGSATFSNPTNIDHPYFPVTPGTTRTYRSVSADTVEQILIEVLQGTREVAGVDCRIVRDRVYVDGLLIEDTFDWYAQDDAGNVWYMGEEVTDFNYDDAGRLIDVEHPGAWETGKDVAEVGVTALPGHIMPAVRSLGARFHQEYYPGEAEDFAEIVGVDVAVTLSDGTTFSTLKTRDLSSVDPSISSFKYYASGIGVVLEESPDGERVELVGGGEPIPLKETKLIIEHNATDEDTGFQGSIDSDGWQRLDITGPNGVVVSLEGQGRLGEFGLTELFFETVEPPNAEVPIADVLATLPEGNYTIAGPTPDGKWTTGTAALTHRIPAGPVLTFPAEGATVSSTNLVVTWNPVTRSISGDAVSIIRYQVIVEVDEAPHPTAIGKRGMSIFVPASVTSVTVPNEFLEPGTHYQWEVLAVEESGNQTLSSSEFTTR